MGNNSKMGSGGIDCGMRKINFSATVHVTCGTLVARVGRRAGFIRTEGTALHSTTALCGRSPRMCVSMEGT